VPAPVPVRAVPAPVPVEAGNVKVAVDCKSMAKDTGLLKFLGMNKPLQPPKAGVYHFRQKGEQGESRMHLRVEEDGSGLLLVNASRIYHFNPTATFMTYMALNGTGDRLAGKALTHAYNVPRWQATYDYHKIADQINLITTPGYENLAGQIRFFSGMKASQISVLKEAARSAQLDEIYESTRFLSPSDEESLAALIPMLAASPKEKVQDFTRELTEQGEIELADHISTIRQINQVELGKLIAAFTTVEDTIEPIWDTILPFSKKDLSAPYRMDLAITYRCNNRCHHCYNPQNRQRQELDTDTWKAILDQLWQIGIPHIIFTGGEPTVRQDLPALVAHAEGNGQITGINTNGRLLKDKALVKSLVEAGLDHVQITLESHRPEIHDAMVGMQGAWEDTIQGLKNVLEMNLYVMTNTTLLESNSSSLADMLDFLADLGVKRVGLNSLIYSGHGLNVNSGLPEEALPQLLSQAQEITARNGQKLTWYTPTQYCHFDPVLMDNEKLGVKGCTAALYNMCIEPDGSVIPCQSYYHSLGNIREKPWEAIWNHRLALDMRERRSLPEECHECGLLPVCGGGCPLAREAGQMAPPQAIPFYEV
jgi:radical SAM protein with 4Fe4S-binding SPASM domain